MLSLLFCEDLGWADDTLAVLPLRSSCIFFFAAESSWISLFFASDLLVPFLVLWILLLVELVDVNFNFIFLLPRLRLVLLFPDNFFPSLADCLLLFFNFLR